MRVVRLHAERPETGDKTFTHHPLSSSYRRTPIYLFAIRYVAAPLTQPTRIRFDPLAPSLIGFPGCGKTFTRSDAMNKHLRSLHGVITEPPNKKKVKEPQTVLTQQPLTSEKKFEWTPSSDADLLEDEEVAEVLPRLRRREMFWSTTEEDHRLVKAVRDRHPRGGHKGKGRDEDSVDSFDEGVGARYPVQPGVVGMMADQDEAGGGKEVDVMGRPRWQVRYIMGKAKLMLVEEENSMRRRELRDLMELERRMQAGERLEWCP